MKRREWIAKQKLQIVLDCLKNQVTVSDLCSKYSITQGQYYKWRDQLLNNGEKAFKFNPDKALVEAKKDIHRLKSIIGTLTVEFKKPNSSCYETNEKSASSRTRSADS